MPCPPHPPQLDILIILGEEYKSCNSLICSYCPPPITSLSSIQIFFAVPCSQAPSVYVPPLMPETKFTAIQGHRRNFGLTYSNCYVLQQQMRHRSFQTKRQQALPEFNLPLTFSLIKLLLLSSLNIWIVTHFQTTCLLFYMFQFWPPLWWQGTNILIFLCFIASYVTYSKCIFEDQLTLCLNHLYWC
jgi:hypothetical protein